MPKRISIWELNARNAKDRRRCIVASEANPNGRHRDIAKRRRELALYFEARALLDSHVWRAADTLRVAYGRAKSAGDDEVVAAVRDLLGGEPKRRGLKDRPRINERRRKDADERAETDRTRTEDGSAARVVPIRQLPGVRLGDSRGEKQSEGRSFFRLHGV